MAMSDFIPQFRTKTPKKFSEEKWLNPNEPQVILFQGMRGAGKGVAVDKTAEDLYKEGVNIWHIWGARSFENLYWVVNKNCKEKYAKIKLILEAFVEQIPLKKWATKNNMSEEEFYHYIEIMREQKITTNLGNGNERIEEFGEQILHELEPQTYPCLHPKKWHDNSGGQLYCMGCNQNL